MAFEIVVGAATEVARCVWEAAIEPRHIRAFGGGGSEFGEVSVLLLESQVFDPDKSALRFSVGDVHLLNIGRSSTTIIIGSGYPDSTKSNRETNPSLIEVRSDAVQYGSGDRQFLHALEQLPDEIKQAGAQILASVRHHFPGDLYPRSGRRFQETPDNFWFVTVQPRDRSLSITVRGLPDRFKVSRLRIVADRSPYSRFKVKGLDDVSEAITVILSATRKR
jgi:hypothetical protein